MDMAELAGKLKDIVKEGRGRRGRGGASPSPFWGGGRTTRILGAEWSVHQSPDLMIEVWNTAALMEAVLAALLDDPEGLAKAQRLLGPKRERGAAYFSDATVITTTS